MQARILKSLSYVALFCLLSLSIAQTEVRSVSDYQVTSVREMDAELSGTAINVTRRIYAAFFGEEMAGNVVSQDLSRDYLSMLFGQVPGSLDGEEEGVIALLFRIFNIGIVSVASLLVIYSTVFGLSAGSHDGGAMGSGRYSPWAIGRVVGSLAALVPTVSGYSLIQILVMKVVLAGVVSANTVWEASIDFLNERGSDSTFTATPPTGVEDDRARNLLSQGEPERLGRGVYRATLPKEASSQRYQEYRFVDAVKIDGHVRNGTYLLRINQAILDTVNMYKPCREMMEGVVGAEARPTFVVEQYRSDVQAKLQLFGGGKTVIIRGFDVTGVNADIRPYLMGYIAGVGKDLLILMQQNGDSEQEVITGILAKHLKTFYEQVRSRAVMDLLTLSEDVVNKVIGLKEQGWVSAGYKYKTLYTMERQLPENPSYFDHVLRDKAGLRNYEYVYPEGSSDIADCLKTRELRTDMSNQELTYDTGGFVGLSGEDRYKLKQAFHVISDGGVIGERYQKMYYPTIHKAVTQDITDYLQRTFSAFLAKIGGRYDMGLDRLIPIPGIAIDTGIIANQLKMMGLSVNGIILDMILGQETYDKTLTKELVSTQASMKEEDYACDLTTEAEPLTKMQKAGGCIIKSVGIYFRASRSKLYDAVTKATWEAYGVSTGATIAQGAVKGVAQWYQLQAKKAGEAGNSHSEENNLAKANKAGALGKVSSMVFDPLLAIIEFSQATAKTIMSVYLPMANGLAVTYMGVGVLFATYIPYMPTLIFMFAVLAWFFAVVEAMIAAPLVMIGFANPEGHDMMGKSEQGIMLLLGVFIRPMVTIIGFLLAMTVTFSVVSLFNNLFSLSVLVFMRSVFSQLNGEGYAISALFVSSGLSVLYAYALLIIVEQCYSIIYVVPDQILKWIGGPLDGAGSNIAGALRQASSGLSKHTEAASKGVGSATQGSMRV